MKREKVIELARNLGWEYDDEEGNIYYDGTPITSMLTIFSRHLSRLVELETLERAAMVCKDKSIKMENEAALSDTQDDAISLRSSAWLISVCGNEILNLKDSHDNE